MYVCVCRCVLEYLTFIQTGSELQTNTDLDVGVLLYLAHAGLDILRDEGHSYFAAVAAAVAEAEEAGETGEAGENCDLEHVDWRCWDSACHGFITPASPFSEPRSDALIQELLAYVATRLAPLGVTFTGSARSKL